MLPFKITHTGSEAQTLKSCGWIVYEKKCDRRKFVSCQQHSCHSNEGQGSCSTFKHAERGVAAEEGSVVITEPEIGESDREGKVAVDSFFLLYLIF